MEWEGGGARRLIAGNDPDKIREIQGLLDKKLTDGLNEEQRVQIHAAIEESDKFECEANAQALVSVMDKLLVLTAHHRELLEPKIASWLNGKSLYMQQYTQRNNFLPDFPVSIIENVLTLDQRKRFNAINKNTYDRLSIELQTIQHQPQLAEQDY